ncbi:hypothetical protein V8E53_011992 [Lactarius tabidus]
MRGDRENDNAEESEVLLPPKVSAYFVNFVSRLAETFFPHCQCTLDDNTGSAPCTCHFPTRLFSPCPTGRCRWRCGSSVNHRTSGSQSHRTCAGSQEGQVVHVPHDCSGGSTNTCWFPLTMPPHILHLTLSSLQTLSLAEGYSWRRSFAPNATRHLGKIPIITTPFRLTSSRVLFLRPEPPSFEIVELGNKISYLEEQNNPNIGP